MMKTTTTTNATKSSFAQAFKARQDARDIEAIYQALVKDNENRKERGLPTFEPSYELAEGIIKGEDVTPEFKFPQFDCTREQKLYGPYFDSVKNSRDWKAPIDAFCRAADRDYIASAIAFYTATEATFEPTANPDWLRVRAAGYRLGPAGDH